MYDQAGFQEIHASSSAPWMTQAARESSWVQSSCHMLLLMISNGHSSELKGRWGLQELAGGHESQHDWRGDGHGGSTGAWLCGC